MNLRSALALLVVCASTVAHLRATESNAFAIFVSNERSGDVSVIDGQTNAVVATLPAGKRPRGIHCSPDGKHVYLVLSGSPRMAPGVDSERAPADKTADALAYVETGRARGKVVIAVKQ
jgi:YVTN family beta-propeller protein